MSQPDDPRGAFPIDEPAWIPGRAWRSLRASTRRASTSATTPAARSPTSRGRTRIICAELARHPSGIRYARRDCPRDGVSRAERERLAPLTSARSRF